MPRKRGNGAGSVCQRQSDKQWLAVLSYKGLDGKRHRATRYANSRRHAEILLQDLRQEVFGLAPPPSSLTVGQFLTDWLRDTIKPNCAEATHDSYRRAVSNHIVPLIGTGRLLDLTPYHIQSWITAMAGGARTRQLAFVVLQSALSQAARLRLIETNPCDVIDRPKADREEILPFTAAEAQSILAATADERLAGVYLIAMSHGLRQGEIFGLRWIDADLSKGRIRIEQQAVEVAGRIVFRAPKTKAGRRTIHVSDRVLAAIEQRKAFALKEGHAASALIFPNRNGEPMRRSNFGARHWAPLLSDLGLAHRGFHHSRHTAATLMLGAGIPVHEVSRILGHARPSITLDIYAHWISTPKSAATHAVDKAIFG